MDNRFSFERALGYAFSAPGGAVFIPLYGLAYALIGTASFGAIGWAASGSIAGFIRAAEADAAPDAILTAAAPLIGWGVLLLVWSWVLWAVFETASQRRFIWHKGFSLAFGGDELRMMVVGVFWFLLNLAIWGIVMVAVFGSVAASLTISDGGPDEQAAVGAVLGALGLMLVLFPVYVFFATRFAPSFGQTVKEKRVRFSDAWNISRGRFWPILGAFVILAFAGLVVNQVVSGIAQMLIIPQISQLASGTGGESPEQILEMFTSPGAIAAFGGYLFITLFMQGILQHINGAPAALAARTDPRRSLEDAGRVDTFT